MTFNKLTSTLNNNTTESAKAIGLLSTPTNLLIASSSDEAIDVTAVIKHTHPLVPSIPRSQPNEIFVGNLSFFCNEKHLYDYFSLYSHVTNVRITRNVHKHRSLMFGFVAFKTPQEAREMAKLMDGHFFMGRYLRIEVTDALKLPHELKNKQENAEQENKKVATNNAGFQVHLHFISNFTVSFSLSLCLYLNEKVNRFLCESKYL
jgi:RNA recognition motif-containing protein